MLDNYIKSFNLNIKNYKVICFVAVDGCGSCIDPSLNYAKAEHENFLLVLTSIHKKSIDYTIERIHINHNNFIIDHKNLACKNGLSTQIAPCFYFLRNGKVDKKVDLSTIPDKVSILKEVDDYLKKN
jgi:hypothetical protein